MACCFFSLVFTKFHRIKIIFKNKIFFIFRCWLSGTAFYIGFLAPITIILVANCFIYASIMYKLFGSKKNAPTKIQARTSNTFLQLRRSFSLMVLFGLTWVFAYLAIGNASVVFQWLFTIFNSLQGLGIFVFNCCFNAEVRAAWRESCVRISGFRRVSQQTDNLTLSSTNPNRSASS